jgi:hypothetical protein
MIIRRLVQILLSGDIHTSMMKHKPLSYRYIKLKLFVYVCMFAYSSRTDESICTKLAMLIP